MSLRKLPEIKAFQHSDLLQFDPPEDAVAGFNQQIAAAKDEGENVISLYGPIGIDPWTGTDNSERRVSAELRAIGKRDVEVNLNSPGGNYLSGLAIYNLLRAHPAKVTVNVLAMAASAGSVIAMAGDDVLMADGAMMMLHNASAVFIGNRHEAKDAIELLSDVDDAMAEVYAARAGVGKSEAAAWMDKSRGRGTYFSAAEAIKNGLADGKLPSSAIKVKAEADAPHMPPERVAERALMAAHGMSSVEAKGLVASLKSGARDAAGDDGMRDAATNVTRDADDMRAALEQLRSTIRS